MSLSRVSALVHSPWLSRQVNKVKLLDCSWTALKGGHEDYLSKHIPGARFCDLNKCVRATPTLPRNLPDPQCFEEYAQSLGLNTDSHIVVYDRGAMLSAARTWWTFRVYGHERVSVLDGGLGKWESDGHDTTMEEPPSQKGDFKININKSLMRNFQEMKDKIQDKSQQLVDARRPEHFSGSEQEPTAFTLKALEGMSQVAPSCMARGHIPGAKNLMEDYLLDPDTKCLLTKDELLKVFGDCGIDLSIPMTMMCYNGHAATLLALAAHVCGQEDASVYYGSWTEWGQRASPDLVICPSSPGVPGG